MWHFNRTHRDNLPSNQFYSLMLLQYAALCEAQVVANRKKAALAPFPFNNLSPN